MLWALMSIVFCFYLCTYALLAPWVGVCVSSPAMPFGECGVKCITKTKKKQKKIVFTMFKFITYNACNTLQSSFMCSILSYKYCKIFSKLC